MQNKLIKSVTLLLLAAVMFFSAGVKIPVLDSSAETYFSNTIQKASLAYATTRVINASVSVIKDSELQLEPGGVGVSLAVGEVVDPIDDMTERLSDVLVAAIASLGVQRILYEMGISIVPSALAVLLILFSALVWLQKRKIDSIKTYLLGVTAVIIVARFFLPISALVNDLLYKDYFLDDIVEARKELTLASNELDTLKEIHLPEIDGISGTIKNSAEFLKVKKKELKDALDVIKNDMGEIVSNLLKLTWLYVGIFFIQVIALPLLMFWLLVKLVNALFSTTLPMVLGRSDMGETSGI